MKRSKLGSVMAAMGLGVVMIGASAADPVAVAQADEGPSGPVAALTLTAAQIPVNAALRQPATAARKPELLDANGSCPRGMVEVEGDYCSNVEQKCIRWIDPEDTPARRCAEFEPVPSECKGRTTHKHFCIDAFEYPNEPGKNPIVMKTWYEAKNACSAQGKRLCGDSEWTLACEGQDRLPYPYGYARDAEACNIDKPHPDVDEKAIANPATRQAEVDRLWQGEPSGSRESCVSPFGVHDMTGNVDEWVVNESGKPYKSGLKGGYWGPVRDRCRPMTIAHNEEFLFYQIGFRCCSDAGAAAKAPAAPQPARGGSINVNPAAGSITGS